MIKNSATPAPDCITMGIILLWPYYFLQHYSLNVFIIRIMDVLEQIGSRKLSNTAAIFFFFISFDFIIIFFFFKPRSSASSTLQQHCAAVTKSMSNCIRGLQLFSFFFFLQRRAFKLIWLAVKPHAGARTRGTHADTCARARERGHTHIRTQGEKERNTHTHARFTPNTDKSERRRYMQREGEK